MTDFKTTLALGKENYRLMIIGVAIEIIGFLLMIGGKAENPAEFNPEIFSFQRITLAPALVLIGFGMVGYGIIKKAKAKAEEITK